MTGCGPVLGYFLHWVVRRVQVDLSNDLYPQHCMQFSVSVFSFDGWVAGVCFPHESFGMEVVCCWVRLG